MRLLQILQIFLFTYLLKRACYLHQRGYVSVGFFVCSSVSRNTLELWVNCQKILTGVSRTHLCQEASCYILRGTRGTYCKKNIKLVCITGCVQPLSNPQLPVRQSNCKPTILVYCYSILASIFVNSQHD